MRALRQRLSRSRVGCDRRRPRQAPRTSYVTHFCRSEIEYGRGTVDGAARLGGSRVRARRGVWHGAPSGPGHGVVLSDRRPKKPVAPYPTRALNGHARTTPCSIAAVSVRRTPRFRNACFSGTYDRRPSDRKRVVSSTTTRYGALTTHGWKLIAVILSRKNPCVIRPYTLLSPDPRPPPPSGNARRQYERFSQPCKRSRRARFCGGRGKGGRAAAARL